ncbi:hypothetical protein NA57DRAFT_51789 [Rhizodiscina lignyota]|uniref:Uncharacterized protein n=1 Tax=Rhizodiscina lignyota TaxID=1504668 RepID=A0A9P4IS27_9PEZI|nr:hypothetical protein NA57DRAFT_51789 [Rhizodiscina lignyota]
MSSSQLKELADIPKDFIKDGTQFLNRCTKPDKREFLKISQAVGVGFVIMGMRRTNSSALQSSRCMSQQNKFANALCRTGTIGYFVKLIHIPVNNILVGGS